MVYPLLLLGALAIAIMLDRAVVYMRMLRLPRALVELVETYEFALGRIGKANSRRCRRRMAIGASSR